MCCKIYMIDGKRILLGAAGALLVLVSASALNKVSQEDTELLSDYQQRQPIVSNGDRDVARQYIYEHSSHPRSDRTLYIASLIAGVSSLTIPQLTGAQKRNSSR